MKIFKEIALLRAFLGEKKKFGLSLGLVPTMGALHRGHLALIQAAQQANEVTICSVFVNPTQFNNATDLEKYPRNLDGDIQLLESAGCDVLFAPDTKEMYENASGLTFDFGQLDKILEGKFRPGHFSGVALAVSKLFNIVEPSRAYFGQKDYQQFQIIQVLTQELKFNLQLHSHPIIREADGLAMSSRNQRLDNKERTNATALYRALMIARNALHENASWADARQAAWKMMEETPDVKPEYFELAHRENLLVQENVSNDDAVLLVAAHVGKIRLIDNQLLKE